MINQEKLSFIPRVDLTVEENCIPTLANLITRVYKVLQTNHLEGHISRVEFAFNKDVGRYLPEHDSVNSETAVLFNDNGDVDQTLEAYQAEQHGNGIADYLPIGLVHSLFIAELLDNCFYQD